MVLGKLYEIRFQEPAQQNIDGFERWSLPLGNGYMGINVFGGVETELISVTENSVFNNTYPSTTATPTNPFGEERCDSNAGGLNLLGKTYIDFDHSGVENYRRQLRLNDATALVSYDHNGLTYTREYFCSYPDKVTVMRLSASEAGALSFTLRPEAVYCHPYLHTEGDGMGKTGFVTAQGDTITLKGTMEYYQTNYEGLYKVIPVGGTMAANDNGTITVTDADSAVILLAVGTNYHMNADTFLGAAKEKLDPAEDPHEKVQGYLDAAAAKSYDQLLAGHKADYCALYDRATLDLGGVASDTVTTDTLIQSYQNGYYDPYLEEIAFQFGRYLLISSSREGCLPANLQGIWNFGDSAAWSGGPCAVKYPEVGSATLRNSKGEAVSFTADGDLIRFDTRKCEHYTITGIPAHTPGLDALGALTVSRSGDAAELCWTASQGAVSYSVYRAVGDAPDYELLAEGVNGLRYTYSALADSPVTFRVTALSADGTRSRGVTAVLVP